MTRLLLLPFALLAVSGAARAQTAPVGEDAAFKTCLRSAVLRMESSGRSPSDLAAAAEKQCGRVRQTIDSSRPAAARDDARLFAAKTVVAYRLCKNSGACEFALGR